ncbi:MAG: DUF1295 domain-containing protein [Desulfobacterales bacterium]
MLRLDHQPGPENVTIADSFWGPGASDHCMAHLFQRHGFIGRKIILTGLVMLWGVRLFLHLHARNAGNSEDPRYAAWRENTAPTSGSSACSRCFWCRPCFSGSSL